MTFAQKMLDERRLGYAEGREEGREETSNTYVAALKGILEPTVIAEKFKLPLDKVLEILNG